MGRFKKTGRLQGNAFSYLPVEVQYQILSYVEPGELLSLARSETRLREMLMSKGSGQKIWEASFELLYGKGLPRCPDFDLLNEPQYADLLFKFGCLECLNVRSMKTDWKKCVRLCTDCYKKRKMRLNSDSDLYNWPDGLPSDHNTRSTWTDFSMEVYEWTETDRIHQKTAKGDILEERMQAIREKLRELAYEPQDYEPVLREPWIKDRRPLTDRVWRNIKDKLITKIEEVKTQRELRIAQEEERKAEEARILERKRSLRQDREPLLLQRYNTKTRSNEFNEMFVPSFQIISETKECKELLESLDEHTYNQKVNTWISRIKDDKIDTYHDRIYQHLLDCAGTNRSNIGTLTMAFTCRECQTMGLIWPTLITHRCFCNNVEVFGREDPQMYRFNFRTRVFDLTENRKKILGSVISWLGFSEDREMAHKELIDFGEIWSLDTESPKHFRQWSEDWSLGTHNLDRRPNRQQYDRVVSRLTDIAESVDGISPKTMDWNFLVEACFVLKGRVIHFINDAQY